MTEKRFEFREINELPILPKCYDTEKQEYANLFECVGWLNELYRENEQLKTTIQQLTNDNTKQKKKLNTAMKENEELKSLIKALKKSNADFINQIKRAYDENLSVKELADNCGVDLE